MKRDLISCKPSYSEFFFDTPVSSTETLAGVVRQLPGSGAPCSSIAYSGLSRSQQQVAMQALGPPATPCFSGNQGGVVLDGVLLRTGGQGWWAALSGRFRTQKAVKLVRDSKDKSKKRFKEALKGENYGICCRCKWTLGRKSTLNLMYEISSLKELREKLSRPELYPEQFQAGHLQLKHKILKGHELSASVACNLRYQEESGRTGDELPLLASVDLASRARNEPLFQYRLGISNVIGQLYEKGDHLESSGQIDNPYVQQTSAQGAFGFQKRFTLFQSPKNGKRKTKKNQLSSQNNNYWQLSQSQSPSILSGNSDKQKQPNVASNTTNAQKGSQNGRAQEIQKLLKDARECLEYVRTNLQEMIEDVEDGTFREHLKLLGRSKPNRRSLYNVFAVSKVQLMMKGGWRAHHIIRPAIPSTPTPSTVSAPFAHVNLHTQLGNFTRPILSFTSADFGIQYNLVSQQFSPDNNLFNAATQQQQDQKGLEYNRAFALESGRNWNCVSVGFAQQILGPIVGKADFKYELSGVLDGEPLQQRLVDNCYGIDVALPGGVAKFSMWWAPKHREAFAEIRTW